MTERLESSEVLSKADYFTVSVRRYLVYEVLSLGIWSLYWYYRNWKAINQSAYKKKFSPTARAFFFNFTAFSLFRKILQGAKKWGYPESYPSFLLAALLILFGVLDKIVNLLPMRSGREIVFTILLAGVTLIASPLILSPVIRAIRYIQSKNGKDPQADNRLTWGQYVCFVLGIVCWIGGVLVGMKNP